MMDWREMLGGAPPPLPPEPRPLATSGGNGGGSGACRIAPAPIPAAYAQRADALARRLHRLSLIEPSALGQTRIAAARRFIAHGWASKALALGWPEPLLFGADPRGPWMRLDRLGAAYFSARVRSVSGDAIAYEGPTFLRRAGRTEGQPFPWDRPMRGAPAASSPREAPD